MKKKKFTFKTTHPSKGEKIQEEIVEALSLAKEIIDYCCGDAWERECTEKLRNRFYEICNKYIPEPEKPPLLFDDAYCSICERHFIHEKAYKDHTKGKRHKKNVAEQRREIIK